MFLCGSNQSLTRTRTLFLRIVSICYACAFLSLYPQIQGLYGPNGILPVHMVVRETADISELPDLVGERPSLVVMSGAVGIAPDHLMEIISLVGCVLSFVATLAPRFAGKTTFFLLWLFYFSIYQVGQTFLWFQWDILLLEVGFLSILLAPGYGSSYREPRCQDHLTLTLIKWLLFRMMYASGVVKLTSGCPTWWGLTALPLHYESQCIPTFLAWFAHRWLPTTVHKLSVISTYVIEIPFTFLFFAPTAGLRKLTFWSQVFLMLTIMATGNYNFFNLLFIGLCISVVDDSWFDRSDCRRKSSIVSKLVFFFNAGIVAVIAYLTAINFFDAKTSELKVTFSKSQFSKFVQDSSQFGIVLGAVALAEASLVSTYKSIFSGTRGIIAKVFDLTWTIFYTAVAFQIFVASLPVFTRGIGTSPPDFAPKANGHILRLVQRFDLIHSYGLFRRMTGVGGRPEIIIEGADSRSGPWKEYEFMYKPGNVSLAPKFCLPHQPRLDWQMWFAALGRAEQNPWFISLVYRLLQNEKPVLQLLEVDRNPFSRKPPNVIRAKLYHYRFTQSDNDTEWWVREEQGEYLPPVDQEPLAAYLEQLGILSTTKVAPKTRLRVVRDLLKFLRTQAKRLEPHQIVWSLSWLAFPVLYPIIGIF